ncbi:MAG: DUF4404 family protein [Chloroflexota bacterium]
MDEDPQFQRMESEVAMADKNLSKLLEELHDALDTTQAVDEKGRKLLRALNEDIKELLERSEGADSEEPFLERLRETITHFENTHPAFTSTLSRLLTALSNAGI